MKSSKKIIKSQKAEINEIKVLFKRFERFLKEGLLKIEGRVENIEDGQNEIKEGQKRLETKVDNLEITLDGFMEKVDNLVKENVVGADQYKEHNVKIKDHEARITTLESQ